MKKIGILTGYWSTNVGNAFFQLGAQHVLKKIFPDDLIVPVPDMQGYINPAKGNPANSLDYLSDLDLDYLVILGPFIRPEFPSIALPPLKKLAAKGTQFIAMGVGMMQYDSETIGNVAALAKELPIRAFVTRDSQTYKAFGNLFPAAFDAIDVAFFVSDVWPDIAPKFEKPYIALNFDQIPEPKFVPTENPVQATNVIELGSKRYELLFPATRRKLCEASFVNQVIDRVLFSAGEPGFTGEFDYIRTDHRYNPVSLKKIYASPRTFSSDVPWPYLSIYRGAHTTFSNRVHACVATLSFGNQAMLFSKSPRAYLLERAGASTIKERPTRLDMEKIRQEKNAMIEFLGNALVG